MEQPHAPKLPSPCLTSVFKSGENDDLKKGLTEKWIELINQLEKKKETAPGQ